MCPIFGSQCLQGYDTRLNLDAEVLSFLLMSVMSALVVGGGFTFGCLQGPEGLFFNCFFFVFFYKVF